MESSNSVQQLRILIERAGFKTQREFAEAAGLKDYEVSRICSESSPRRPTGLQVRKMAAVLKKSPAELAAMLLPAGDAEQELLSDVIQERDAFIEELAGTRTQLAETRGKLEAAEKQIRILVKTASELQQNKDHLDGDLAQERARSGELIKRQHELIGQKGILEEENRKLQRMIDEAQQQLESIKQEAARDLARLYTQVQVTRDELGRERAKGVQRQILAGTLGAMAGAIIRGSNNGNRRNDDDEQDDDLDD